MKTIEIKDIYDKSPSNNKVFTADEILHLTKRKSKNIFNGIVKYTRINFFIKLVISFGIIGLFPMFSMSIEILVLNLLLLALSFLLSVYDLYFANQINQIQIFSDDIATNLIRLNKFHTHNFANYKIVSALSNPLLVIVAMEYYRFVKYGSFRLEALDDLIVFLVIILLSYVVSLIGANCISAEIKAEIEDGVVEISDREEMTQFILAAEKRKRKQQIIYAVLILFGLISFAIAIALYLNVLY